jgi:delta14-sterol reductase/lamin-B receptor
MVFVCASQFLYVWDALYQERAILSTMDVTTDGFGFMLCFGDLAWVPFTYSLQARYLSLRALGSGPGGGEFGEFVGEPALPPAALAAVAALFGLGYWIFRGANGQKDAFRRDPDGPACAGLRTMDTKRGRRLLVDGWWGLARKINYTGDWLMALSWSLACGARHPQPYFYPVYFAVLLVHRAWRDDHACRSKYGDDWGRYKAAVPCVYVPGLF